MKLLTYINKIQAKPSDLLEKSYKQNFCGNISNEELTSLENHQILYKKVLDELGGKVNGVEEMSFRFNSHFENNVSELLSLSQHYVKPDHASAAASKVSLFDRETWSRPFWTYQNKLPIIDTPKNDLSLIIQKLGSNQNGDVYQNISVGLKDQTQTHLSPGVLKYYLQGIKNIDLTGWDRFTESVFYTADFIKSTLTASELSVMLEYCVRNEKFLFLLVFPYFFKPLKKLLWSYLFPVFSLTAHSFTFFLKEVALAIGNIIKHKNTLVHGFCNLKVSRSVKLTLGTGGLSGLLLLYNKFIFKDTQALAPLYTGLEGCVGQYASLVRIEVSKVIFELTKTTSTFMNAALAGFLEPKQDVVKQILKSMPKK